MTIGREEVIYKKSILQANSGEEQFLQGRS